MRTEAQRNNTLKIQAAQQARQDREQRARQRKNLKTLTDDELISTARSAFAANALKLDMLIESEVLRRNNPVLEARYIEVGRAWVDKEREGKDKDNPLVRGTNLWGEDTARP